MTFGRSGAGEGEFKSPAGLAFDKDDNVYVTEIGNNRVQVFDKTGKFLTMWGSKGSGNGEFGNLHGIIVDKADRPRLRRRYRQQPHPGVQAGQTDGRRARAMTGAPAAIRAR